MRLYTLLFLVAALVTIGLSCKKQEPQAGPSRFDPQVDGIAVRPLPALDSALAERILKEGAILPTADISAEGDAALAPTSATPPAQTTPAAEMEPEKESPASSAPQPRKSRTAFDPNN